MDSRGSPLQLTPTFALLSLSIQKLKELYDAIDSGALKTDHAEEHKADIMRIFQEAFEAVDKQIFILEHKK